MIPLTTQHDDHVKRIKRGEGYYAEEKGKEGEG